jgi:hypothetical protein
MNVYELGRKPTRLTEGRDHDIDMRDFPGRIDFGWYMDVDGKALPTPLEFVTPEPVAPHTDFPFTSSGYPVMSRRMGQVLAAHAVGANLHPVRFVLRNGRPTNDDYVLFLVPETKDLFDRDASLWEPSTLFPDRVGYVSKLVLRWPPTLGVALGDVEVKHYVAEAVKQEIEVLGMRGVEFSPVETSG